MNEFNSQVFQKFKEITDVEQLSPQERKEYYASWKAYNDYANTLEYAKQEGKAEGIKEGKKERLEEGMERGIKQGMEEGIEKGIKQGIEEGEQKAKFTIAATLKRQGVDVTLITQATGLSPEEINRLSTVITGKHPVFRLKERRAFPCRSFVLRHLSGYRYPAFSVRAPYFGSGRLAEVTPNS